MEHVVAIFRDHLDELIAEIARQQQARSLDTFADLTEDQVARSTALAVRAFLKDLQGSQPRHFAAFWEASGRVQARRGADIAEILEAATIAQLTINDHMTTHLANDAAAMAWWVRRNVLITASGFLALSRHFIETREATIVAQQEQLRQLASPIMPLYAGVMVLPLVGTIDATRGTEIMETLLNGVSATQAEVVLIDITGVPVVDVEVANYLLQTARAARLLGTRVVLVGISPEIAQTLVQLDLTLAELASRANLQDGLEHAFELLGLAIVRR